MPQPTSERHPRGLAAAASIAALLTAVAACSNTPPKEPESSEGTGGEEGGGAGSSGSGGGGRGGAAGMAGRGGTGGADARIPDETPTGGSPGVDAAAPLDSATPGDDAGPSACGMPAQACCPGNTCLAGATPSTTEGTAGGGMTVLELKASGGDPYAYFASKNLMPIDGPSSGYITDTGTSFYFVLHQNGAEETVSSGAQRQRNEVTVNPGNPAMYKGMHGDTMSYTWRFRLEKMNSNPTWCDIFQVKQHGTLGPAPFMALEADKGNLNVDTQRLGVVAHVPLSEIMGIWINASVTAKYSETGSLALTLKKEDGQVVLSYKNDNINLWGAGLDFVRPKWGFYRNKRDGAGEAAIHYNDMKIIRGTVGTAPACTCKN